MKRTMIAMMVAVMLLACGNVWAGWSTFVIRNATSDGTTPAILDNSDYGQPAKEFVISMSGMKAAWGTNDLNGLTVGDIVSLGIDRLDDRTRFTSGSGSYVAPYFNFWVTDGAGNYAIIANEPSNGAFQPLYSDGYDLSWSDIAGKVAKAYENSDMSWITSLDTGSDGLTFSDVASLMIAVPDANASWAGLGTGAPRKLNPSYDGTNAQYLDIYGFNWVFGDTLSHYVSGDDGYIVANPVATPEPATLALMGLGGVLTFLGRRRRK